ncbi:MAG: non-heme iron oxygenase ferredoxin subunit [Candidatus Nanopelagicales bacterium]
MSAVQVCKLADIPQVGALAVVVEGTPVAVVRDEDGAVHAIRDVCSHADVALSEGEVDGCTIECWLHGSRFDLRTGQPSGPPATSPVPVYRVSIEGDGDDAVVLVDTAARPH